MYQEYPKWVTLKDGERRLVQSEQEEETYELQEEPEPLSDADQEKAARDSAIRAASATGQQANAELDPSPGVRGGLSDPTGPEDAAEPPKPSPLASKEELAQYEQAKKQYDEQMKAYRDESLTKDKAKTKKPGLRTESKPEQLPAEKRRGEQPEQLPAERDDDEDDDEPKRLGGKKK